MKTANAPIYYILFNFTHQGIRNVKDTIKRAEAFKTAAEKVGGKVISFSPLKLQMMKQ
jgi:uncharacterized protein with GYD domain